jgi:uncharacterized membrane protein YsdA (DUF1294 family)
MNSLVPLAIGGLAVVNLLAVGSFWDDKQRAIQGKRRIPESDLLSLALLGGSPGALLGRKLFRHKTRKEPFSTQLFVIIALQIGGLTGLAIAFL